MKIDYFWTNFLSQKLGEGVIVLVRPERQPRVIPTTPLEQLIWRELGNNWVPSYSIYISDSVGYKPYDKMRMTNRLVSLLMKVDIDKNDAIRTAEMWTQEGFAKYLTAFNERMGTGEKHALWWKGGGFYFIKLPKESVDEWVYQTIRMYSAKPREDDWYVYFKLISPLSVLDLLEKFGVIEPPEKAADWAMLYVRGKNVERWPTSSRRA